MPWRHHAFSLERVLARKQSRCWCFPRAPLHLPRSWYCQEARKQSTMRHLHPATPAGKRSAYLRWQSIAHALPMSPHRPSIFHREKRWTVLPLDSLNLYEPSEGNVTEWIFITRLFLLFPSEILSSVLMLRIALLSGPKRSAVIG